MASLKHFAVLILFGAFSLVFKVLPVSGARRVGAWIGTLTRILLPSQGRRVRSHLEKAFPTWGSRKITRCIRENFRHYGMTFAELYHLEKLYPSVEISGIHHLSGTGVVLVTGHCGNWELMARTIARRCGGLTVVAREAYLDTLNDFLVGLRKKGGVETILRGSSDSPRQLLSAVKEGRTLGMLIDQDTKVEGIFVPFFNHPAHTPVGAARLALKYGIPSVTGFIHRTPSGGHILHFDDPIQSEGHTEETLTALLTRRIEDQVRRHPTQWVWVHRRWKKVPSREEVNSGS